MSLNRKELFLKTQEMFPELTPGNRAYEAGVKTVLFRTIQPTIDEQTFLLNDEVQKFVSSFSRVVKRHSDKQNRTAPFMFTKFASFYDTEINFSTVPLPIPMEIDVQDGATAMFDIHDDISASPRVTFADHDYTAPASNLPSEEDAVLALADAIPNALSFDSLSKTQQYRLAENIQCQASKQGPRRHGAIILAAQQSFERLGYKDAGYVVRKLRQDPEVGTKLKQALVSNDESSGQSQAIKPLKALSMILYLGQTVKSYNDLREDTNAAAGFNMYPSYYSISQAKEASRPENIDYGDFNAQCPLQSLLENTLDCILNDRDIFKQIRRLREENNGDVIELFLAGKTGIDGATGHVVVNQRTANGENPHDNSLIATQYVCLQLTAKVNGKDVIVFTNQLYNSYDSCRPLRYWHSRETHDALVEETDRLKGEIATLHPYQYLPNVRIHFQVINCMNDGKVLNILTNNDCTQRCPLCKLLERQYRNADQDDYEISPEDINLLCLSILHFGLRLFDNLLKIGCSQSFKSHTCVDINKPAFNRRRDEIRDAFREEKGLLIDIPKPGGHGTSNDGEFTKYLHLYNFKFKIFNFFAGNTVRRAFEDPEFLARQIGVSTELVTKLSNVWIALKVGLPLDADKFGQYCDGVKELYRHEVPWAKMNPATHRIIDHGALLLRVLPPGLNISMLSEEPLESNHRIIKFDELHHARQMSRRQRLMDVFNRGMDRSNPEVLAHVVPKRLRDQRSKRHDSIPKEVLDLCKNVEVEPSSFTPDDHQN